MFWSRKYGLRKICVTNISYGILRIAEMLTLEARGRGGDLSGHSVAHKARNRAKF